MESCASSAFELAQLVAVGGVLAVAVVSDMRRRVIPNEAVLAVCALGASGVAWRILAGEGVPAALAPSLAGALVALVPLVAVALAAGGVGGGDVKLLGALGLVLGPLPTCALLALSCLFEVAFALLRWLVLRVRRQARPHDGPLLRHALPFAPFIAAAFPLAAIIRCSC